VLPRRVRSYRTFFTLTAPFAFCFFDFLFFAGYVSVYFLCHFPSSVPDRRYPPTARECDFPLPFDPSGATARQARCCVTRKSEGRRRNAVWLTAKERSYPTDPHGLPGLSVRLRADLILLELLVQIAARRSDPCRPSESFQRSRATFRQETPLGVLLDSRSVPRPWPSPLGPAFGAASPPPRRSSR